MIHLYFKSCKAIIVPFKLSIHFIIGLKKDTNPESGRLGIFDGEEILFSTSDYTAVTIAKLMWRYGMDAYNIKNWVQDKILKPLTR